MALPPMYFAKVNVDTTFFEDSSQMGVGIIIHDAEGEFISCRTIVVPGVFRVDEGEAMGLLEAFSWIKQLGFERVIFLIDAKLVFDALAATGSASSVFNDFILSWLLLSHGRPMSRLIVLLEPLGLFLVLKFRLSLQ
ncbi:hypothetical protein ACS0TY_030483 [Phlomoides rotata]